jgi:four helix bundle protein
MTKEDIMRRLKQSALGVARMVLKLPYNVVNKNYADQCNRSASSAAANYRAATRGESHADFVIN